MVDINFEDLVTYGSHKRSFFNQQRNINNHFERTTKVHIIINNETSIIKTTINQNIYSQTFEGPFYRWLILLLQIQCINVFQKLLIKHHQASVSSLKVMV